MVQVVVCDLKLERGEVQTGVFMCINERVSRQVFVVVVRQVVQMDGTGGCPQPRIGGGKVQQGMFLYHDGKVSRQVFVLVAMRRCSLYQVWMVQTT
jgi:hypothetical protein